MPGQLKFYKLKQPGGFLGNFYPSRMWIGGRWWSWAEAPYQAAKTVIKEDEDLIWGAKTARESRELGQKVKMREDWDQVKRDVMKDVCFAKFLQHPDLRKQLMETGDLELIEDSPIDWYWGIGADGTGKNVLGQVLMEIRTELAGE